MVSARLVLFTLSAASAVVGLSPAYLKKRQATRASVTERLFVREVLPADPEPSPTPVCYCWDGSVCPNNCPEGCPEEPPMVTVTERGLPPRAPAAKQVKVRGAVPRREFSGEFLSPAHAARFLAHGGSFRHTNGSHIRDDVFIANNARLRARAARSFAGHHLLRRGGEKLVRLGGGWLAGRLLRFMMGGSDDEMVVPFSEEWAVRVNDLMPTVRELLADDTLAEVNIYHHSISRHMLEEILAAMCPRMGDQICGASAQVPEDFE
ncbi:hypothetical protein AURDEDRAFT_174833 [Auricularia subglabra TFB-10046 SS5]|nr:hypothetical protein AURDEDRAFT_174833 [Auricularia subglabra TFB-10046 SS5]